MTPEEQYIQISDQIDALKKQQDKLKAEILRNHKVDGEIISGLRRCTNKNVDGEKLKNALTDAQYRRVTERKVVSAYLTAEIKRGNIDAQVVNDCRVDGQPYLKRV